MLEGLIMDKVPRAILPVILTLVLLVTGCSAGPEPPDGRAQQLLLEAPR